MAPPIIFGLKPTSLTARAMPTEWGGWEQTTTRSGFVSAIARTTGTRSVVVDGYLRSYTTVRPAALAFSRAPSASPVGRHDRDCLRLRILPHRQVEKAFCEGWLRVWPGCNHADLVH